MQSPETTTIIAAAVVIQRAWRRSENLASLARKLDGDFIAKMKAEQYSSADPCSMLQQEMRENFKQWVRKLLIRGGSTLNPEELCRRSLEISACWLLVVLKDERAFWQENSPLISAAVNLVESFLDLHDGDFEFLRDLDIEINGFLNELDLWRQHESRQFFPVLRRSVVELLHRVLISRPQDAAFSLKRQLTLYSVLDSSAASALIESNVYRAVYLASKNEFWKSATVSRAKTLHEIIIHNGVYTVPVSQSFPSLSTKHAARDDGRIVDSPAFRDDIMSCLLSCVNEGDVLEQIADMFYATKGNNTREFADAVIAVFRDIFRGSAVLEGVIEAEWSAKGDSEPLEAIVHCVCKARNMLDNAAVGYIRESAEQFISENTIAAPVLNLLQVRKLDRTQRWIHALLPACSKETIAALSAGNPFALLEFFNASVLGLVLSGSQVVVDYLSQDHIPEFLHFDRDRLVDIRLDLSTSSPTLEPKHLTELVTADRWMGPSHACTPTVRRSAEILRRVLQLHRYCHGHVLCSFIVDAAAELA